MLNRFNLNIAALASKEESRYSLCGIQVTKERTCVTDGHCLVTVSAPDLPHADIPMIEGIAPSENPAPFILPAKEALAIASALPKKTMIPILNNAFVESGEGDIAKVAVTDLESPRIFNVKKIAGAYPNIDQVIPSQESAEIAIAVDANLLINILKALAPLPAACDKNHLAAVVMRIKDPESPIRFDVENKETGQKGLGVLMPLLDKTATHAVLPRDLTIELEDGRVKSIYCDKALHVTVVSREYQAAKDKTVFTSCQHWKGSKDIFESSRMPAELKKYIEKEAGPVKEEKKKNAKTDPEPAPAAEVAPAAPAPPAAEKPAEIPNHPTWKAAAEANAKPRIGASTAPPEPAAQPAAVETPAKRRATVKPPAAPVAEPQKTKQAASPAAKAANGWDNPEVRAKRIAAIRAARAGKAA